ncbi:Diaminopropionate ammonia-lyase [Defluviimonas aquaemixtae]|uniref:Diaminopropionate ammonia-lyase n=1 Tax=Albidovulum aquaemixtae TaxID=1542388 RepID=A0A2R8BLF9_9RHOB|nr:pyridoxal-phosphate dependent enzyme [Defluviimonas aquaemixtae]SPH24227.1 Diaminopropionate ammonia-lyase [Defluviimonas aquaemixtae]
MVESLANPYRSTGLPGASRDADGLPSTDAASVARLLALCPAHEVTPLHDAPALAGRAGVARVSIKDERRRMGLGSFKALGAAYAIAHAADEARTGDWADALKGRVYVAASAGNHGLSVAAGARLFGAEAVIYLAETVPEAFAERLRAIGARVVREGATYEESMDAAQTVADRKAWQLLSDSSWPGYIDLPRRVMEGYLQLAAEAESQIGTPPTHILLQAGVGGLAAAVAAHVRTVWGEEPIIVVVEPKAAPALMESIRAGRLVTAEGPVSSMGRLDCKTPSMVALAGLARDADLFVTITEEEVAQGVAELATFGYATTPSGGAGLAALLAGLPGIGDDAHALAILSEGTEDV